MLKRKKSAPRAPQENSRHCFSCGAPTRNWTDYFCPVCGAHNDALYRLEHAAPSVGKALSSDEIGTEYTLAGMPFEHNPNLMTGDDILAVSVGRSAVRR